MNYKSLINPLNTTVEKTLLGQKVYLRRLTSAELDDYNDKVEAGRQARLPSRAVRDGGKPVSGSAGQ